LEKQIRTAEKMFIGLTGHAKTFYVEVFPFRLDFRFEDFILSDNTVYNRKLAKFGAVAANAAYGRPHKNKKLGHIFGDGRGFFEDLGFRDVRRVNVDAPGETDPDDVTVLLIGHARVETDEGASEVIAVSSRGSVTAADWLSDLDVGADTEAYRSLTGEHPEWTDKTLHKGFAVTANRALSFIDRYVEENTDPEAERIIFLTGHSRGASVTNILGTVFEEREDYKAFTYTFAAARTTTSPTEKTGSYRTIFNLVNENDMVPELPAAGWNGFKRFGTDIVFQGSVFHNHHRQLTGYAYQPAIGSEVDRALTSVIKSIEDFYEFDVEKSYVRVGRYDTREEAEEAFKDRQLKAEKEENADCLRLLLTEKEKNGKEVFELGYQMRPYYIQKLAGQALHAKGLGGLLRVRLLRLSGPYMNMILKLAIPVATGSFVKSHMLPIYYGFVSESIEGRPRSILSGRHRIRAILKHWKLVLMEAAGNIGIKGLSLLSRIKTLLSKKQE